jgi:hypothetical protein
MIRLLVASMHILYSKDIWTTLQIRVICLKHFQCWFSMTLHLVICPYSQKLPTSGISPSHFLITCDWIALVLFCHGFFLSFRIVLTVECDELGCKLSVLFLTTIYLKLYASLQSRCSPPPPFFFVQFIKTCMFQFWLKVDISCADICFYNHLNKQCFQQKLQRKMQHFLSSKLDHYCFGFVNNYTTDDCSRTIMQCLCFFTLSSRG